MPTWSLQHWHQKGSLNTDLHVKTGEHIAGREILNHTKIIVHPEQNLRAGFSLPLDRLLTGGIVYSIVHLLGGGIAAGTAEIVKKSVWRKYRGSVVLFNSSAMIRGRNAYPYARLIPSGGVSSLCILSSHGLAVGTFHGGVDLFNSTALLYGGTAYAQLQVANEKIVSLAVLEGGGLAAATRNRVDLFNLSAVLYGGHPYAQLRAGGALDETVCFGGLLALPDGGIAVGNCGKIGLFRAEVLLFNSSAVQGGGLDYAQLLISESGYPCQTIPMAALPGGSIAVGLRGSYVSLYNASVVQRGGKKFARLTTNDPVTSLLTLPGVGLVAGVFRPTNFHGELLLFNVSTVRYGGWHAYKRLVTTGKVRFIVSLPAGGLAAGTNGGIDLFNASTADRSYEPLIRLSTSGVINSLTALPDGGLAAVTQIGEVARVELFSSYVVQNGGSAYAHLKTDELWSSREHSVAIAVLADGGLALGGSVILLFNSSAVQQGGRAYATLAFPCTFVRCCVESLVAWSNGRLLALRSGEAFLFNLSAVQNGGEALYGSLPVTQLFKVLALPDGGLAAASWSTKQYKVLMFNLSAVENCGQAYRTLPSPFDITFLDTMPDGSLAVGTSLGHVHFFNSSAERFGGKPYMELVGLQGLPVYSFVALPRMFVISGVVLEHIACPASTYATSDGVCVSCPHASFSLQGATSCPFHSYQSVIRVIISALVSCCLFYIVVKLCLLVSRNLWSRQSRVARVLLWIFIFSLLFWPPRTSVGVSNYFELTVTRKAMLTIVCAKLFYVIHVRMKATQGSGPLSTVAVLPWVLILTVFFSSLCQIYAIDAKGIDSGSCVAVWTVFGTSCDNNPWFAWMSTFCSSLCILELFSYALSGKSVELEDLIENAASSSIPPSSLALSSRTPVSLRQPFDVSEASLQAPYTHHTLEICEASFDRHLWPRSSTAEVGARSCTAVNSQIARFFSDLCKCMAHCVEKALACIKFLGIIWIGQQALRAVAYAQSWQGRQIACGVNGLLNVIVLTHQLVNSLELPQQGLLAVCIFFAIKATVISVISLVADKFDKKFRWASLTKSCMFIGKVVLLSFPVYSKVGIASLWSCGPDDFCPDWCTQSHRDAYCQTIGDTCMCSSPRVNKIILALLLTTNVVLALINVVHVAEPTAPVVLTYVGLNISHLLSVGTLSWLPMHVYVNEPSAAMLASLPVIPAGLLINEVRWILETWRERQIRHVQIYDMRGLSVFVVAYCLAALVCICGQSPAQWNVLSLDFANGHLHPLLFISYTFGIVSALMAAAVIRPRKL